MSLPPRAATGRRSEVGGMWQAKNAHPRETQVFASNRRELAQSPIRNKLSVKFPWKKSLEALLHHPRWPRTTSWPMVVGGGVAVLFLGGRVTLVIFVSTNARPHATRSGVGHLEIKVEDFI